MPRLTWKRSSIAIVASAGPVVAMWAIALANQLNSPYIDPRYYRDIPFGAHSHWAQPWRAYLETIPAVVFVNGTGINFNVEPQQAGNVAMMLAKHGIHHARVEVGWGSFDYAREDRLLDPAGLGRKLEALQRYGIRPLILLNANSGAPCPLRVSHRKIARDAARGDRALVLDGVDGLVPGYSGLSNLGDERGAAKVVITALHGNLATLSKPLPVPLAAGTDVEIATLKYRPFSTPGSADFAATLKGWQTYAVNVARIARADLGTAGKPDAGFDLEIWNELTFGSEFLSIDNYYSPAPEAHSESAAWAPIAAATAAIAESRRDLFSGVLIGDGFANTIPWTASATEPARIDAIDKHPYASRKNFPADEYKGARLNAALQTDDYVPAYSAYFPEYFATFLQTETIVRDMGPIDGDVYGTRHGRNGRIVNGKHKPVTIWITEVNGSPAEDDPRISGAAALDIKAKTTARYFCFFLNKGVTQVDLYAASDKDAGLGIVRDNFLAYAGRSGARYPADDRPFLSPALLVTGRIVGKMNEGLNRNLVHGRALHIDRLAAANDPVIFKGDGTRLHPDLHAVDAFAFLPYQVNARRLVIPYYVMTRDVMKPWPEDLFSVTVSGFLHSARYSVYDPLDDKTTNVTALRNGSGVTLPLPTSDYPRLLIVDEVAQ